MEESSSHIGPPPPRGVFADLDALRLSVASFGSGGIAEVTAHVPVRKPQRQEFIRVNPGEDMTLTTAVYEDKEDREFYFVAPAMIPAMLGEVVPVTLLTVINRQNVLYLWPVKVITDGKANPWVDTAQRAAARARDKWVRVASDMSLGAYRIYEAVGDLPPPEWPQKSLSELLEIAFKDRIIDSDDHKIMKRLRGAA